MEKHDQKKAHPSGRPVIVRVMKRRESWAMPTRREPLTVRLVAEQKQTTAIGFVWDMTHG